MGNMEFRDRYYTVSELSQLSGLTEARIRQLCKLGDELKCVKPFTYRLWLIEKSEGQRWLAVRSNTETQEKKE